jgi:hypothetical protein
MEGCSTDELMEILNVTLDELEELQDQWFGPGWMEDFMDTSG